MRKEIMLRPETLRKCTLNYEDGKQGINLPLFMPEYGEIRIVTHAGKVTFVETTTKEKVE